MEKLAIDNIKKLKELSSELDLEKANSLYIKLRKLQKNNEEYKAVRAHLKQLILTYEKMHWEDEESITTEQLKESDTAESVVCAEDIFLHERKIIIKEKLKEKGLNQSKLAEILGHSKNYMSELINGLRPLSKDDIILISRLFSIEISNLLPPFIEEEKLQRVKSAIGSIANDKIKLTVHDLDAIGC